MKKLFILLSLVGVVNSQGALDLVRVSELPSTNVVTTNDIMLIVSQPFTTNAITRRIAIQDVVNSLIKPQVITTNLYVTNIYVQTIIVGDTNSALSGYLTYPKIPYAYSTNILADGPMSVLDSTTVAAPSMVVSNSLTGLGVGTNYLNPLSVNTYFKLLHLVPGTVIVDGSGNLTNGVSNGTNTMVFQLGPFTVGTYPVADTTNTLTDGHLFKVGTTNVGINSQLVWGPGETNKLFRRGSALEYTNNSSGGTSIRIASGEDVNAASFGVRNGDARINAETSRSIWLTPNGGSGGSFVFSNTGLFSDVDNVKSIGSTASNGAFKDSYFKGAYYAIGMNDGAGNNSWLKLYHSGTNGSIIADSQSSGTAGLPRPFAFQFGTGTNYYLMTSNSLTAYGYVAGTGGGQFISQGNTAGSFSTGQGFSVEPLNSATAGTPTQSSPGFITRGSFWDSDDSVARTFLGYTRMNGFSGTVPVGFMELSVGPIGGNISPALTLTDTQDALLGGYSGLSYTNTIRTTNFVYVINSTNSPTGVPKISTMLPGFTAITFDTANERMYYYMNGAWKSVPNIRPNYTPASSAEVGKIGTMAWDSSYLYIWTDTNVNKRVSLSTW